MGKYSKLKTKLPQFRPEKEWQQKVDEAKREILGLTPRQKASGEDANVAMLARRFAVARRAKKQLEERVGQYNTTLEALSQLLVDRLEGEEQQSVELRGGVTVSLKDEVYPTLEDKKKFFAYVKRTFSPAEVFGLLNVHPSTFKALVKDLLEHGRAIPPGTKVFIKTSATCRGLHLNGGGDE